MGRRTGEQAINAGLGPHSRRLRMSETALLLFDITRTLKMNCIMGTILNTPSSRLTSLEMALECISTDVHG